MRPCDKTTSVSKTSRSLWPVGTRGDWRNGPHACVRQEDVAPLEWFSGTYNRRCHEHAWAARSGKARLARIRDHRYQRSSHICVTSRLLLACALAPHDGGPKGSMLEVKGAVSRNRAERDPRRVGLVSEPSTSYGVAGQTVICPVATRWRPRTQLPPEGRGCYPRKHQCPALQPSGIAHTAQKLHGGNSYFQGSSDMVFLRFPNGQFLRLSVPKAFPRVDLQGNLPPSLGRWVPDFQPFLAASVPSCPSWASPEGSPGGAGCLQAT